MKRIKFLGLLLLAVSAVAFTSCLSNDDDDDNSLSPAQVQTCYNAVKGSHSGKFFYQTGNNVNENDTLDATWEITSDSTLVIRSFPAKALASAFTNDELSQSLAEKPAQDITCRIGFIRVSPVQWLINPETVTYEDVSYNGTSHKLQVLFYINNFYSFGAYNADSNVMQLQILAAGAYLDGKYDSSLMKTKPFIFFKR